MDRPVVPLGTFPWAFLTPGAQGPSFSSLAWTAFKEKGRTSSEPDGKDEPGRFTE